MKWRFLNSGKCDPAENMAIDEAIFNGVIKGTSLPTIRFYGWNPPSVSCGYNQELEKEVDLDAVAKCGFGFVRRQTGGRTVLHNEEITYSVIAPIAECLKGNIIDSYSEISRALAEGLKILGIDVEFEKGSLSSHHQRTATNPCFSSSSRFELNYHNKKIVGSAQVRSNNVLLQHGSILLHFNQSKIADVLPGLSNEQKARIKEYFNKKTIAINQILPSPVDEDRAISALKSGFKKTWNNDKFIFCENIEPFEKENADYLVETKYLTEVWNKRK